MERLPYTGMTLRRLLMLGSAAAQERDYSVIGNPVAFRTNLAKPLSSLLIPFTPIQSLNGQDAPYPPGGGVNQWDGVYASGEIYSNTGNIYPDESSPYFYSVNAVQVDDTKTYYIYGETNNSIRGRFYDANGDYIGYSVAEGQTIAGQTFKPPVGAKFMRFAPLKENFPNHKISINYPATDTAYHPYANICPISGWDGLTAQRTGKNLLPNKKYQYSATQVRLGGENSTEVYKKLKAGTYTLSVTGNVNVQCYYTHDGANRLLGSNGGTLTVTEADEDKSYCFYCYKSGSLSADDVLTWQLELGETASPYTEYTGQSYPVTFPDGQTIYGGTLDAVTGVLTVTHAMKDLGSLNYTKQSGSDNVSVFTTAGFGDKKHGVTNIISDLFVTTSVTSWGSTKPDNRLCGSASGTTVVIRADAYTDATSLKPALDGHTAVYELATPITYQLDPITVQTLIGDNVIWTDTNGQNTVTYKKKG